jgi:hypothetical protein
MGPMEKFGPTEMDADFCTLGTTLKPPASGPLW